MIDSSMLGAYSQAYDASDITSIISDFSKRLFEDTSHRFQERSERILYTRAMRNEEITVPVPDSLISDEDISFVAYIAPERKTIESHMRQSWSANVPVCKRVRLSDDDSGVSNTDMAQAFAEGLKAQIVAFDPIIGRLVEDGEMAVVLQYDLDYLLATPSPHDILDEDGWKKLPKAEQGDWRPVRRSGGRIEYRRYKTTYWRDKSGRSTADPYYRKLNDDGTRRRFERDELATRRAWKAHAKAIEQGKIPILVRLIPALDVAPILQRGVGRRPWECRGLAIRSKFEESDLLARGLWWNGAGGEMTPVAFGAERTRGRMVDFYEAHVYLDDPDDPDGLPAPCIIYCADGHPTWSVSGPEGAKSMEPAVINLKERYGITKLPANYFWGAHSEDSDPDFYGFPVIYPLVSTILNREGTRTSFQAHLRKYAFSKLAMVPDPKMPAAAYTNADGSFKDIDLDKEVVTLPGPVTTLVQPPPPTAVLALDGMYTQDLQANSPADPLAGGGASGASGHSLTVQKAYFNSANSHVLEGARECVEWIMTTALEMVAALDTKMGIRVAVPPADEVPQGGQGRARKSLLEYQPSWFEGSYAIKAVYPSVGNLAEIQQTADLADRGYASFEDVMDKRQKASVQEERIKIMLDQFWKSPVGQQMLFLDVLRRRGQIEQADQLEAQLNREIQPNGLPTAAIPPDIAAMASQLPPGGGMSTGSGMLPNSPMGAQQPGQPQPMGGLQMPNIAGSALGGLIQGAVGTGPMLADARATAALPTPGGG